MKILISGASGLIGSALARSLSPFADELVPLVRSRDAPNGIFWRPSQGMLDPAALDGVDAVIHLSGENIAQGRWTAAKKRAILDSRVRSTALLAERIASAQQRPSVWVCASAIGYYGSRGDEILTENSPSGEGFLAEVCRQWEAATQPAAEAGVRVVNLRLGPVLSPAGGALAKMLPPFKLGLGGVIGSGAQYMSWVTLEDVAAAVAYVLDTGSLSGPINMTAPAPVTNRAFTKTLGRVLGRPTVFPMPAFAARLAFGEMADEMLLSSTRVMPERLKQSGFAFQDPELEPALRRLLVR